MERVKFMLHYCVFWISFGAIFVHGQIGVSYCACQPSVYTFTFNFSAYCDIATVDGPGVIDSDCIESGVGLGSENTIDTVPVQITSVSVAELNKDLAVLEQTVYVDDFRDGDSFTYTSILNSPNNITGLTPDTIPGGIQLDLFGINKLEQPITNVWIIEFDPVCGIYPILEVGDQIGWTILSDLKEPLQAVCPLAPPPPTTSPTSMPTKMPDSYTTSQPSLSPSDAPSLTPTRLCPPDNGLDPGDHSDQPSSSPVKGTKTTKGTKRAKTMNQRKKSDDSIAFLFNQYHFHRRDATHMHQFYGAPNLDATGRGVGTRTPVATPVECPDSAPRITEKKQQNFDASRGSKSDVLRNSKLSKNNQRKGQKKEPNSFSQRTPKGDLRSIEKPPTTDDDASFIVLTRSPSPPPIGLSALVHLLKRDPNIGN